MKSIPDTEQLLAEVEEERKALKIAFSTHDGQLALKHLQEIFGRASSVRTGQNGHVDPFATLVCEGSREVVIYIEECIANEN